MDDHGMTSKGPWPAGWIWALVAAVIGAVLARWLGDVSIAAAVVLGLMVFIVFAVLLAQFWDPVVGGDHDDHGHDHGHGDAGHDHGAAPVAIATAPAAAAPMMPMTPTATSMAPLAPAPMTAPAAAAPVMAPAVRAMAQPAPQPVTAPLAPQATPLVSPAMMAPTPTAATAAPIADAAAAVPQPAPAPAMAAPAAVPAAGMEATKPQGMSAPRNGKADELQEIEGIGPVLEKLCHDMGIFHFDQIASWGASEVGWMDGNLKGFKGRVTRDKWVAQARLIGAEGIDAFRIRAKTNDY